VGAPGVLANDVDADGNPLTAGLVSSVGHGLLLFNNDGSFMYAPDAGYSGVDFFIYRANDGTADSNPAIVTITVGTPPVNTPPVAVDDAYSTPFNTALNVPAPGVLSNDTDIDGNPLTAALVSGPASGTLTLNANGSFDFTPAVGFSGNVTFTYRANDGTADSNTATVTISVGAAGNTPPVAVNDSYTTSEDTALNVPAPGVLGNDTDANGDPLTAVLVSGPASGTLTLNANGSFVYTPNAGFVGADSFTYQAADASSLSNVATVTIQVLSGVVPGGTPRASDDVLVTGPGTPATVTAASLLANDSIPAGVPAVISAVSQGMHGTVTSVGNLITYTPNASFTGQDAFTYTVDLGGGVTLQATVWVTVWKPVPACRDIGGEPNSIVYALVPGAVVPTPADVYCRVVVENGTFVRPAGEIGNQDMINLGILQAVEVFSLGGGQWYDTFTAPVDICLAGSGRILFMSATGQPRVPGAPPTRSADGYTCATISTAGTVLLVP